MDERQDRLLGRCILAGAAWLGLHLFVGGRNMIDSMYKTFDRWTFVWMAVYAIALAVLDVLLFCLNSASAAKSWAKYWGFCTGFTALTLLVQIFRVELGLWALLPAAATMLAHIYPLWACFFPGDALGYGVCALLLSAAHLLYFLWLRRRADKEKYLIEFEKEGGPL